MDYKKPFKKEVKYNMENIIIFLRLIPAGRWAKVGAYNSLSSRTLRFDIELNRCRCQSYDSLESGEYDTFTMCGSTTKNHSGDQGIEEIVKKYCDRVPKEKLLDFNHLIAIWREYHLNNYTPGTKKQEDALAVWKRDNQYDYTKACDYLNSINLLVDRGYRYGTAWLCKPIPKNELEFIRKVCKEWSDENA